MVKKIHRGLTEEQLERAKCKESPTGAHHWLIETSEGESPQGTCKYCDEDRRFPAGLVYGGARELRDVAPANKTYVEGLGGSKC